MPKSVARKSRLRKSRGRKSRGRKSAVHNNNNNSVSRKRKSSRKKKKSSRKKRKSSKKKRNMKGGDITEDKKQEVIKLLKKFYLEKNIPLHIISTEEIDFPFYASNNVPSLLKEYLKKMSEKLTGKFLVGKDKIEFDKRVNAAIDTLDFTGLTLSNEGIYTPLNEVVQATETVYEQLARATAPSKSTPPTRANNLQEVYGFLYTFSQNIKDIKNTQDLILNNFKSADGKLVLK
jgi:hypothetical protein